MRGSNQFTIEGMKPSKPFIFAAVAMSFGPIVSGVEHDPAVVPHDHSPHEDHVPVQYRTQSPWVASGQNVIYRSPVYRGPQLFIASANDLGRIVDFDFGDDQG